MSRASRILIGFVGIAVLGGLALFAYFQTRPREAVAVRLAKGESRTSLGLSLPVVYVDGNVADALYVVIPGIGPVPIEDADIRWSDGRTTTAECSLSRVEAPVDSSSAFLALLSGPALAECVPTSVQWEGDVIPCSIVSVERFRKVGGSLVQ